MMMPVPNDASLTAVNLAKALSIGSGMNPSVEDVKLLIHNTGMVQRILSTFRENTELEPKSGKIQRTVVLWRKIRRLMIKKSTNY